MAYYEEHAFVSANDTISRLKDFLEANGWTTDLYVASGNYRLHVHRGVLHLEFQTTGTSVFNICACTGYTDGAAYNAQPNICNTSYKYIYGTVDSAMALVSTTNGIWIGSSHNTLYNWAGACIIVDKIGTWSDGLFVVGNMDARFFTTDMNSNTYGDAQIYYNGHWSNTAATSGAYDEVFGLQPVMTTYTPNLFNGAIIPMQPLVGVRDSSDYAKYVPLGFIPELYYTRCGQGIYNIGDIITIGSDSYLALPVYTTVMSGGCVLFKIEEE